MINLVHDTIDKADIKALCDWLSQDETPRLTKGALTVELEQRWASMIGTDHAVFVNSGSSAILLALAALKDWQGLNKKIVVPALSWGTDLSSAVLMGFEPILVDCNLTDLSVDLEQLELIFEEQRPGALLLVSVLGLVPDMGKITQLCEKYNVLLLEDTCESMGSRYYKRSLGSFGYASMFSMYFGHHISTIEGGFINTNDTDYYDRLIMMRSHGWSRDLSKIKQEELRQLHNVSEFDDMYTFYVPGMNLRSTDLQAFIGLRSIQKLEEFTCKREDNFNLLNRALCHKNILKIDAPFIHTTSSFAYPMVVGDRDTVVKRLKGKVDVRPLIAGSLAAHPAWSSTSFSTDAYLPNATMIHEGGLYLPVHQGLSQEDIKTIASLI